MRISKLRGIGLTMSALATLAMTATAVAADDNADKSDTAPPAAAKSTSGVPTLARRPRLASQLPPTPTPDVPAAESPKSGQQPAGQPKTAEEPLSPIASPQEGAPVALETASFKGIAPGVATKEDVAKAWGQPKEVARLKGSVAKLYCIEPFKRVEVNYAGDKVSSIVIRLDHGFPAEAVAKQLDLSAIRPVLVSNDLGEMLGLSYPERGVLLAFEPGTEADKPGSRKIAQIILEPISAESLVLRAETTLDERRDLSRRDLEQAIKLEPDNARAHWLLGRVLAGADDPQQALISASEAVRL